MSEEKKEVKKEEPKEAKPEKLKAQAPASATATLATVPAQGGKPTRPTTCVHCGKNLKRKTWFYRNGKWYCTKRCYRVALEKQKEEKAKAQASATPAPAIPPTPTSTSSQS